MLEYIWFWVMFAVSVLFCAKVTFNDNESIVYYIGSVFFMAVAMVLSWNKIGDVVLNYILDFLPQKGERIYSFTALVLIGAWCIAMALALPMLTWKLLTSMWGDGKSIFYIWKEYFEMKREKVESARERGLSAWTLLIVIGAGVNFANFWSLYDFLTVQMQGAFSNESVVNAIVMIMTCALTMINFVVIWFGVTVLKKLDDARSAQSRQDSSAEAKEV